ncbi:unnamed protein product [Spirodela intermedia]|uniref:Trehalose 6-phosphate phosphatase n=1 Tax=Spirodela intermedia TaxID=51605 RepID=A0A7I8JV13_SPIIN|nr:unnamed protein product [Spirodela intermedia]CAA6673581.1 unnamed protein product [Spirodela intermedia]
MASSSPPRRKQCKDTCIDFLQEDTDAPYRSWLMKYPSALSSFEQIAEKASSKRVALFLDYDGTLSPIVDEPDRAFMSKAVNACLCTKCLEVCPTAIISGRSRDKVYEFVGLTDLYYAGSHGMDINGPCPIGKEVNLFQPASEFIPMIEEVFRSLVESASEIPGSKVENNKFCVSVHYRNVDETNWAAVAQLVHDTLKQYPRLRLTYGRKSLGLDNSDDVLPIYIGDDRTDEDAFEETKASYSLRDPSEVMEFLKSLASWTKSPVWQG